MEFDREKLIWFSVSTAIILGMIWFANIDRFTEKLLAANHVILIPAFISGLMVLPSFALAWFSFFRHMKIPVSYVKSLRMFLAGNFLNGITPLGQFGGEPFMAYIISRNTEASYEKSLSTVISADVMNAMPLFTFTLGGAIYLFYFRSLNQAVLEILAMAVVISILGGGIVYLMWFEAGKIELTLLKIVEKLVNTIGRGETFLNKLESSLEDVEKAFRRIGESPKHLTKVAAITHAGFFLNILSLYFILISLGHPTKIVPLYFVSVAAGLGGFSPTPGGGGTVEAAMAAALTLLTSVPLSVAVAAAILFRLTTYWPGLLLGWLSLNTLKNGNRP